MTTTALTGQMINYNGYSDSTPLEYDEQKGEYFVTIDGKHYKADKNCFLNSKLTGVQQDIQEQSKFHQKWIEHYQDMISFAKDKYSVATTAIIKAKNDIFKLMCFAGADDYKNLDINQQKEYLTYQQTISDNRNIKRRASSDIMFASNRAIDEIADKHISDLQSSMCDYLMA